MAALLHDLRHAVRLLRKSPGFAAAAILTIGLGVAASTVVFSAVDGVLLRPLPYPEAGRLVLVETTRAATGRAGYNSSHPDYIDWRDGSRTFDAMAAASGSGVTLTEGREPERVEAASVTSTLFDVLGLRPTLGAAFPREADRPGGERVVILGDALWRRRFAADPAIVGRRLSLSGTPYTVIGVMPPGARLPGEVEAAQVLLPLALHGDPLTFRGSRYLTVFGRLKRGGTVAEAEADLGAIAARLARQYPDDNAGRGVAITPLQEAIVGDLARPLLVLLAAVAFLLLIACTNVANLLLPRALGRRREMAVRAALGASRRRLVRQLLVESLLLGCLGGALGVVLASWGVDALRALVPPNAPRLDEIAIDARVLAFALLVSVGTGVLFGIVPALSAVRDDLVRSLHGAGRSTRRQGASRALVVLEVALSLVLLAGAGLSLESFRRLLAVHPGFDPEGVLTFNISLPGSRYPRPEQRGAFVSEVLARIRALPGVETAGVITPLPLGGDNIGTTFTVVGRPAPPAGQKPRTDYRAITPGYLEAMRIPLKKGRVLDERDRRGGPAVALVNETLAATVFAGQEPLGQKLLIGVGTDPSDPKVVEVVGVVGDVRNAGLHVPPRPELYVSQAQHSWAWMSVVVRASGGLEDLAAALRREVAAVDPEQAVYLVRPLSELLSRSLAARRFVTSLLSAFALLALALAAVGLYGVLSGSVSQRTAEIGVRMAVGARSADVMRMVLGQAASLAGAGVALGLLAAFALTRLMQSLLYEVSATDPLTFAVVAAVLLAVSLAASYLPARRASLVDPIAALRCE